MNAVGSGLQASGFGPQPRVQRPKVVFGMAAYNRPDTLGQVLESLLSQTCQEFAVVIVDDKPTAEVASIVDTYARRDPRITYEANPVRLGMVGNWRHAFARGRALHPGSEYFAWVSDHDFWHPRWLEVLLGAMDGNPDVVMAYPQMARVFPHYRRLITRPFDTFGMAQPLARLRASTGGMITAGNCIYGLFRASALARVGVFEAVLMPDRLVLLQLALLGQFRQVPEYLWYREVAGVFSHKRQRQMLFADRVPVHTYVPVQVQHFGVLIWHFVVQARGRPAFGRWQGLGYAFAHVWFSTKRELTRDDSWWREALRQTTLGRRLLPGGRPARDLRRRAGVTAADSR